ncbi:formylglycine-generating enzyme family protein [bacterium]|nr:formylglycine-generating enzyme family protein [bacterium]
MKKFFLFVCAAVFVSVFLTGFVENKAKYMAIDLSSGEVTYMDTEPQEGWSDAYKTAKLVLRRIVAGTFIMGSPTNELGRFNNENSHEVTINRPFYIGVFEITQKQYQLITGCDPSEFVGDMKPVQNVSFLDIRGSEKGAAWPSNEDVDDHSFLGKLRARSKMNFDLPTEAQWEYACRAGTATALNNGTDLASIDKDGNLDTLGLYAGNGGLEIWKSKGPTTVGSYQPNAWGLYDMHGNVWEWCLSGKPGIRVFRGGCWRSRAGNCRAARRDGNCQGNASALYGFRVVL